MMSNISRQSTRRCCAALMRTTASARRQEPLQLRAQARRDILALQRVGHIRAKEADLRAAIVSPARVLVAVERRALGMRDHRVGELDLAAGAALLRLQDREEIRLQDV